MQDKNPYVYIYIYIYIRVNSNTYQNMHENSNTSVLNWVYNTLQNYNTITREIQNSIGENFFFFENTKYF